MGTRVTAQRLSSFQMNRTTSESVYKPGFTGQARQGRSMAWLIFWGSGYFFLFCYISTTGVSVSQILETVRK